VANSYQKLQDDVCAWINRRDVLAVLPGFVLLVETEIKQTLRAREIVTSGVQAIDSAYIKLPADFAQMESIRDATTGELLDLKDEWSGHWTNPQSNGWHDGAVVAGAAPSTAYRLVADCIEFLPHPTIPDPPDPNWRPQTVLMGWYAAPKPLLLPSDTNAVLDKLYGVYLFGCCKYAAMWALDDARAQQMDAAFSQAVTRADLHKTQSDYGGAPYRTEYSDVTF
jgi:hypothetical protein